MREVSGENADARRREGDTPSPQLVDLKQMVCDRALGRERHIPKLPQFLFAITSPVLGVIRKRYWVYNLRLRYQTETKLL